MIRGLLSLYSPSYPTALVYMLQSTEYQAGPYLQWYWRTTDFAHVAHRRQLNRTRAAKLLLLGLWLGIVLELAAAAWLIYLGITKQLLGGTGFGAALAVAYPLVWAHLLVVPMALGRLVVVSPRERRLIRKSKTIFHNHPGTVIAVAGSYGKTTMKEMLLTVLSEGKTVAATPGNKNVAVSHAYFARKLTGKEDVVIVEFGEGAPGDVLRFTNTVDPDIVVITGIAPAHLDRYKTLDAAARDIFSVAQHVPAENVFANADSSDAMPYLKQQYQQYNAGGVAGWKVSAMQVTTEGTSFTISKGTHRLNLKSGLLGTHQVGPLAAVVAIAHRLGLNDEQITHGVAKTLPFEHRMQPYWLGGAWIIDDTYNGNFEGMQAGLALLKNLEAKRKLYVTPGLVDQGNMTSQIHHKLGEAIAAAQPDVVVLMQNSVTEHMIAGMEAGGYKGELVIEDQPLNFYTNLDQVVAAGDIVLMQNDWTDNYA